MGVSHIKFPLKPQEHSTSPEEEIQKSSPGSQPTGDPLEPGPGLTQNALLRKAWTLEPRCTHAIYQAQGFLGNYGQEDKGRTEQTL